MYCWRKRYILIAGLIGGASFLTLSLIQKAVMGWSLAPQGFVMPTGVGILCGIFIGVWHSRIILLKEELNEAGLKQELMHDDFVNKAAIGFFQSTPEGRYRAVNEHFASMLGYDKKELLRDDFNIASVYSSPEDREELKRLLEEKKELSDYVIEYHRKDGQRGWMSAFIKQMNDEQGGYYEGFTLNITERKQAENELKESESRFRLLSEVTFTGVAIHDQGVLLDANSLYYQMFGYQPEELLGKQAAAITVAPEFKKELFEMIDSGSSKTYQSLGLRKDASTFPMEITARNIVFKGRPARAGMIVDITERKRAESKLKETTAILQAAMDNSTAGIAIADAPDGRLRYVNDAGLGIRGGEKEKLIKDVDIQAYVSSWQIHHLDGTPYQPEEVPLARAVLKGENVSEEFLIKRPDAEWRTVLANAAPILGDDGQVSAGIVVFLDITESRKAAEELNRIFQMSLDLICVADINSGTFLRVNPAFTAVLGYEPEELLSRPFFDFVHPDDLDATIRVVEDKLKKGVKIIRFENRYHHKKGGWRWLAWVSHPMPEQGVTYALARDITRAKKIENDLIESKNRAEAANKAKSEFLANMSHELRTPLNGVLGMLQLMGTTSLSSEQAEYAKMATQSCRRLTRLLGDILDLSRIEADRMEIKDIAFDLAETLETVDHLFSPAANQSDVAVTFDIDSGTPRTIQGDGTRLQQVLNNLVGNALKFTQQGFVKVTVFELPILRIGKRNVLFSVSDSGIGIPDDKLDSLFEPFTQAEGAFTRQYQGAGLGLSIVKRLVHLMNGTICVESEEGVGSTFHVCIPFVVGEEQVENDQPVVDVAAVPYKGQRILLAEDDKLSAMVVAKQLERIGWIVQVASDGLQTLKHIRGDDFDLVLMDVQMPVMDGVEATKRIREGEAGAAKANIPIIAFTAYAMTGDKEMFLEAGMNGYLAKPVEMEELLKVIEEVMA